MTLHFMNDTINDVESRPPDKSAYWKIIFFISHPKHMWWELKRDGSFEHPKHMSKLMSKKIFTILRSQILFI